VALADPAPDPKKMTPEQKLNEPFFSRLDRAFREQFAQPCYTPPAPPAPASKDAKAAAPTECQRRGQPAPFDGPPYPNGEWQIGGTQIIGDPGILPPGPLTEALWDSTGGLGQWMKANRIQIYGWEDISGNLSTSHDTSRGQNNTFPEAYDLRGNRMEQNQAVVYFERMPDECQTDHWDWGFRISVVYGLDYRYMITKGFLSDDLLKHNRYYDFDLPMMYFNWYIPNFFMGENITIGRIISEADIEAQLAPNNLMSSHSLLYTFDPYTQWGIFTTTKIDPMWTFQIGLSAGNDVTPWTADPGRELTGAVMLQWISKDNKDGFYGGGNAINNATFGYNNIQQYVGTWTHKFDDKWWTTTEAWYMYQDNAVDHPTFAVPYQNGAFPVKGGQFVAEWAILNYTMYRMGPGTFFTVRNEYFDDRDGNRTGFATKYSEHSIGITWWPNKLITIRPELRFEHSYNCKTYDNAGRYSQLTAQVDVVLHF
jgi:hypothetical protein